MKNLPVSSRRVCCVLVAMFVVTLLVAPSAYSQPSIFSDGFEADSLCNWDSRFPDGNCPPRFAGIPLVFSTDVDRLSLTWIEAEDDATPASQLVYWTHVSTEPDFSPSGDNLFSMVVGQNQVEIAGLVPDTRYYILVLVEDQQGAVSLERDYAVATTMAFPVGSGGSIFETTEELLLGEPIDASENSLTFQRTAESVAPTVGGVLAGQDGDSGFLRRVDNVAVNQTTIVVDTSGATLYDAFEQFDIQSTFSLLDLSDSGKGFETTTESGVRRVVVSDQDPILIMEEQIPDELDGLESSDRSANSEIDVSVTFEPDFSLSASWTPFGGIESGEAIAAGTLSANVSAQYLFSGSGSYNPSPIQVFSRTWFAYYQVGPAPVLQKITLTVEAQASATASTEVSAEATAYVSVSGEFGLRYDPNTDQWVTVSSTSFDTGATADLNIEGSVEGEVRLVPRITVETYEALAVQLSIEPSVYASLGIEDTSADLCAPVQLNTFDIGLGVDCFASVSFTAFNANFSLVDERRVCGPFDVPLFSLPDVEIEQAGGGSGDDPAVFTAMLASGLNNNQNLSSSLWQANPDTGTLTPTLSSPPTAEFTCGPDSSYMITYSGHGRLGEVARRCFEVEYPCDGCMTGLWQDNYGQVWDLVQSGESLTGVVTAVSCGTSRNVTGSLVGTSVTLNALGGPPDCCDFTYTGAINECTNGSGSWFQFPGSPECVATGTWSITRISSIQPEPDGGGTPASAVPSAPPNDP